MKTIAQVTEELKASSEDILDKLTKYKSQDKSKIEKEKAINIYNTLGEYNSQETNSDTPRNDHNECITIQEHNKIIEELKAHYKQLLFEQKAEIKRIDDLLFYHEEDNKALRKEIKKLSTDLKETRKSCNQFKKLYNQAKMMSDLLAKKLAESSYIPKRREEYNTRKNVTINIQNFFSMGKSTKVLENELENILNLTTQEAKLINKKY